MPVLPLRTANVPSAERIAAHVAAIGASIVDTVWLRTDTIRACDRNTAAILLAMQRCHIDLGVSNDPRDERFGQEIAAVARALVKVSDGRISARDFLGTLSGIRDAFALLDNQPQDSPLFYIHREHRWRLCIDPADVDRLCAMQEHCGIPESERIPPMFALAYNCGDPVISGDYSKGPPGGYFQSMASSWDHLMLHRQQQVDVEWQRGMHAVSSRPRYSRPGDMNTTEPVPWILIDVSDEALQEMRELKEEVSKLAKEKIPYLPLLRVSSNSIGRGAVSMSAADHLPANATEQQYDEALQEPLKQLAQYWIDACYAILYGDLGLDEKLQAIDVLVMKCLRYHFFEDGNGRTFVYFMMNHLLMELVRLHHPGATPRDEMIAISLLHNSAATPHDEAKGISLIYNLAKLDCSTVSIFATMRRDGQRLVQGWLVDP